MINIYQQLSTSKEFSMSNINAFGQQEV